MKRSGNLFTTWCRSWAAPPCKLCLMEELIWGTELNKKKQREAVCTKSYMSEDFHLLVLDVRRDGVLFRVLLLLLRFLLQFWIKFSLLEMRLDSWIGAEELADFHEVCWLEMKATPDEVAFWSHQLLCCWPTVLESLLTMISNIAMKLLPQSSRYSTSHQIPPLKLFSRKNILVLYQPQSSETNKVAPHSC
jgi:hypothetical protein